jgi:2-dehydro-3-deoxyphosphogluconate aldolase / (4S)-4-hydroxy-2-oxoglutarate aldolase
MAPSAGEVPVPLPPVIAQERLVAVVRGLRVARASQLAEALRDGGVGVVEVTVESGDGPAAIEALRGLDVTVGAGTVTSVRDAADAVAAGASFLVSPHTDEDLLRWARQRDVPFVPGALTPTEVMTARRAGASAVKLFPASLGGPAFVASLLAPYPDLLLLATGGVGPDDARAYLDAGAIAVGLGSWLTGSSDVALVRERAALLRERVPRRGDEPV